MGKAILISILVASVALPALGARDRNGMRGLKRTLLLLLVFNVLYVMMLLVIYAPSYVPPPPPP